MKLKTLFILLTALILSYGLVQGQSVTLDNVEGITDPGIIPIDQQITFNIRLTNNDIARGGITNGFSIYSPDGATWGATVADTFALNWRSMFDLVFQIFKINTDGMGADTVGFGGSKFMFGDGLPPGFDELAYKITIGPIDASHHGKTIILDSTFYPTTGSWKWTPNEKPAWDGPHTYLIKDPNVVENTPPVLDPIGNKSVDEGGVLNITITASDAETTPSITAAGVPLTATYNDNGNGTASFSWSPNYDEAGVYTLTFTASDDQDTDEETITITVNDVNRAPTLNPIGDKDVNENEELSFIIAGSDVDGDDITFTADPLPTGATLVPFGIGGATFTWTPTFDHASAYVITFTASDNQDTDEETITITVNNVNRIPTLDPIGDKVVNENENLNFVISASDPDGSPLSFSAFVLPSDMPIPDGASFTDHGNGTATFDWTPTFDDAAVLTFRFDVTDGEVTVSETIIITINNVNRPPVLDPIGNKFATAGELIEFTVTASDSDGDPVTLTAPILPPNATFTDNHDGTGLFSWQTTLQDNGVFPANFIASDGEFTDEESIDITVGDAPKYLVVDTNFLYFELTQELNEVGSQLLNVTELNGFIVEFSASLPPTSSWISLDGFTTGPTPGTINVIANAAGLMPGTWIDSIFVTSGETVNPVETVLVELLLLEKPNNLPEILTVFDESYTISECDTLEISVAVTDIDQEPLTLSMQSLVENMTFTDYGNDSGLFIFTPNFSQAGVYPITFYVQDAKETVSASFTIIVDECEPGTEGDTVTVATVPAVPGAQIVVPVDFANICTLSEYLVSIGWTSDVITLDSVSFIDSRNTLTIEFITIDNDNNNVSISHSTDAISYQLPGSGNLANLHFSLAIGTPAGFYPLDLFEEPYYDRDCGSGSEVIRPFFIPGGIVVDTSGNYVCGYVIDQNSNPVPGATVELWDDYPTGMPLMTTTASGSGVFAFSDFTQVPFDLYAHETGYIPGSEENLNYAQSGIMIELGMAAPVTPSNTWVILRCETGLATYLGAELPVGTVVEAFVRDDVKCGEFTVSEVGVFGPMAVYGEDTTEIFIPGARLNDAISLKVNNLPAFPSIVPIWTENLAVIDVCFDVPNEIIHPCNLTQGWNLISWNVDTESDDIMTVLSSIDECLEMVMGFEQGALVFDKALPMFSDLWQVDHLSGYWVKVSCDIELNVVGTPILASTPINVTTGWNLVSYIPEVEYATEDALSTIMNDLIIASSYDNGSFFTYVPGQNDFNDLNFMGPCLGYWVKVRNNGQITYVFGAGSPNLVSSDKILVENESSFKEFRPTTSWVSLYSYNLTLNGVEISEGSEITAHNNDGQMVGSYTMKEDGQFGFMSVYGDDPTTENIDGIKSGEVFYLTVDGIKTEEKFVWSYSGDKLELSRLTSKTISDVILPTDYALYQNYPNPFNPTTSIQFNLPQAGKAKIEIFNLLGKRVATPYDDIAPAGMNTIEWDGKNSAGNSVASGIYFYRLSADNYTDTKKMTLIK